jgi:predicted O-linked N-acetylglucosamine transferase (SPINDLY family)/glycosyltransferase involved in cell wall biosynthesis
MKDERMNAFRHQAKQSFFTQPGSFGLSRVDMLLQKAAAHHADGQLPQAEALYRQVVEISPQHSVALHLLGLIAFQGGQSERSLDLIERAIHANPEYAEAYCSRGNALYQLMRYPEAVESFDKAIRLNPMQAEAHHNRGSALNAMHQQKAALQSYDEAIRLDPNYVEAYFNRGNVLLALKQYQAAVESYNKAIRLNPNNAEAFNNRGSALLDLLQYEAAVQSYDRALLLKPGYADALYNREAARCSLNLYQAALQSYEKAVLSSPDYEFKKGTKAFESAMKKVARIAKITGRDRIKKELDALPHAIRTLPAVCNLRNANYAKTESSGRDLVFFCADVGEIWNPQTARTKGIGGSEEAVLWLSRLLHQRGWNVAVYANCGLQEKDYDGVAWKPYWMWNFRDKQDITVIWRHPQLVLYNIHSDAVILDLHDVIPEEEFTRDRLHRIDSIFVKSRFHRSLYPQIPDAKFVIIPNGIDTQLFEDICERDPLLIINTSSADRSLEAFLDCFEEIKKQVPNAKAQWAYGWGIWDVMHSSDAQRLEWKTRMQQRMRELGVEELGRISHHEIALLYRKANVFAYPSEMAEIDCISLSKAMAAGAIPVTTDFAAMGEKSQHGGVFIHSIKTGSDWLQSDQFHYEITDPEQKAEFVRETVKLLLHPPSETDREAMREWARCTFDWNKVADSWDSALSSRMEERALALATSDPSIQADSQQADYEYNRGNVLYLAGQYKTAIESYDKVILLNPDYAEAYCNRGSILYFLKHYQEALKSYDKAILLKPDFVEAHNNRGNVLHALQQYQAAVESYDKAILLKPEFAEAHNNRGNTLLSLRQFQAAVESYDKAILLIPEFAGAYNNRGNALQALGQYQAAVESYDKVILLKPEIVDAHNNRGNAFQALEQYQAAVESYDKALLLRPDYAQAHNNRGSAMHALQQYQAALDSYDKAILLKPDYAEAHNNRGNTLHAIQQYQAALESCDKAIFLNAELAEAYNNRGNTLHFLQQYQAALESYDKAILLKPEFADAYSNRANTLQVLEQYQAALDCYDKVLLLRPGYAYAQGLRLYMRRFLCDWVDTDVDMDSECQRLEAAIDRGEKAAIPFTVLAVSGSPELQRKAAEIYVRDKVPSRSSCAAIPRRPKRDRIRIGYFSADYYNHATSYLMAELFERHDRSRFEILGFSFGPDTVDEMSKRVSSAMDRFLDIRFMPDQEAAQLSRKLEVDIAVDLKGFTRDARTGIFAGRAAPIQVNYLGYPGTMGADYIDYLIADHTLIPQASQCHYSEKIVYLPDSYQVNDSQRPISAKPCTRAGEGLPETAFVFCCFNHAYKITPAVFDIWMRILGRVDGSVLWCLENNPWAVANLRKEAARRGISPECLVFAKRLPLAEHLARQKLADLFLDTSPYNAHTTASDALWGGLPVLTCMGETFASRVGASLLRAINLPELVTESQAEFEQLAVELAHDTQRCQALRQRLQQNRMTAPLFDTQAFTRYLEAAYIAMIERYQAGLPPEHIQIARLPH